MSFQYLLDTNTLSEPARPMKHLARINFDSDVMGGKPCIRGMRVTVGTLVGLLADGRNFK